MPCELNIGFHWDESTKTLVDWEKRHACGKPATHRYRYAVVDRETAMCDEHAAKYRSCIAAGALLGKLIPV